MHTYSSWKVYNIRQVTGLLNFMLLILCMFLQLIHQPTYALYTVLLSAYVDLCIN